MTITQEQIAALVGRLRNSGSRSEIEIHEDREEAADMLEQLAAERDALKARAEAAEAAIQAALERLDASLFTNAEHQQAKDILRGALKDKT